MKKLLNVILSLVVMLNMFGCISAFAVEETTAPSVVNTTEPTGDETTTPSEEDTTTPEEETTTPEEIPTEPALPDQLTLDSVANVVDGIEVKWSGINGADAYNVYRRAAGEAKAVILATVEELRYVDKVIFNGGYYKYSIKPVTDGVEGAESNSILMRYVETPKVTNAVSSIGYASITWTPVEGATAYEMYYRTAGGDWKFYEKLGTHTGTTAFFSDCTSGNYYRFAIKALVGKYTSDINKNGPVLKYLEIPALGKITQKANGLEITWRGTEGATGYNVYRRAAGEKYFTYLKTVITTTYLDSSITKVSTYKYVVKANYNGTLSGYDNKGLVSFFIPAPEPVAIACGSSGIYLKTTYIKDAPGVDVYRRGAGETRYKKIYVLDNGVVGGYRQFKDTNVIVGKYYRYIFMARDSYGKLSAFSTKSVVTRFLPTGTMDKDTAYNFYKYASQTTKKLAPGFTAKQWQNVKYSTTTCKDKDVQKAFQSAFDTLYRPASNPLVVSVAKGSSDSKELLYSCSPAASCVKSATGVKKGNNYVVTVVLKDEYNPDSPNSYGIRYVSPNYFDYRGLVSALRSKGVIYQGSTQSLYKGFTVTAEITPEGKIVNMTHSCDQIYAKMNMSIDFRYGPIIDYNASLGTYLTYSNFKY